MQEIIFLLNNPPMRYAEVLLPLAMPGALTYAVPDEIAGSLSVGCRVVVPLGRSKFYTGIVTAVNVAEPKEFEAKEIALLLDDTPVVRHPQLKLWDWVADYYMCTPGEVYRAAVPAGLKLESETFVELSGETPDDAMQLTDAEVAVLQYLDHEGKRMRLADVSRNTGIRHPSAAVSRLMQRGLAVVSERLVERYRARREVYVAPGFDIADTDATAAAFRAVSAAPKQEAALLATLTMLKSERKAEVPRAAVMERTGVSAAIITAMSHKGVIDIYRKEINRFKYTGPATSPLPQLSQAQSKALGDIHTTMLEHAVTLLHGVTSSGKTEIYMHLIDYTIRQGRQALMLVPEIALTTQLAVRLQKVFGDKVLIYHSKFTDNERVDLWRRMLSPDPPQLILSVRSGIFLPFAQLGLVIVDEEHDQSYKQTEPAPRYNGRDTAIVLASMHGARTLLGSATPAVETYAKARQGRYGLVELTERYGGAKMPRMEIIDIKREQQKGTFSANLTPAARQNIRRALESGRQAIVYLNRRGYAPVAVCRTCGYIAKCDNCDVSLTYHRGIDRLQCHYCGATYPLPAVCPACHDHSIEVAGYGTERLDEELSLAFPDARPARMDLDTTRAKDSYIQIIDDFSAHRADILIGTQMVTKGLDFSEVSAVVIVDADATARQPDFRARERAFAMIEQVAGRAGRRADDATPATVTVQTRQPDEPLFEWAATHDYNALYRAEIEDRRQFIYPPFCRLIYIYFKHTERHTADEAAAAFATRLRQYLGTRVFGPDEPPVGRVQNMYVRRVMLKIEPQASLEKVRELLRAVHESMYAWAPMRSVKCYYDVDPI